MRVRERENWMRRFNTVILRAAMRVEEAGALTSRAAVAVPSPI